MDEKFSVEQILYALCRDFAKKPFPIQPDYFSGSGSNETTQSTTQTGGETDSKESTVKSTVKSIVKSTVKILELPEEVKKFDVSNPSQSVSPTALPQGRARRWKTNLKNAVILGA